MVESLIIITIVLKTRVPNNINFAFTTFKEVYRLSLNREATNHNEQSVIQNAIELKRVDAI